MMNEKMIGESIAVENIREISRNWTFSFKNNNIIRFSITVYFLNRKSKYNYFKDGFFISNENWFRHKAI